MSKSLTRVTNALNAAGLAPKILALQDEARTALQASALAGCAVDQITKSILFWGQKTGGLFLFLTAGGHQVCPQKAAVAAQEPLEKADAALIRLRTGFAIGGVAPVGHLTPSPVWMDPALMGFDQVWAAAGTPRHIFAIAPSALQRLSGAELAAFTQAHT